MDIKIVPVPIEEKTILADLLEAYFSELNTFKALAKDKHGKFGYKYLDLYWQENKRFPFFIKVDGELSGFALVNEQGHINSNTMTIAEFFILPKYRRQGIGKYTAFKIFSMFPGQWEVAEAIKNIPAQLFWRSIIRECTIGEFIETVMDNEKWRGPIQQFNNS